MATAARALTGPMKSARQRAVLDLVRTRVIRTQEELVEALHRRRLDVTQATVSRDIRELGLLRVHDAEGPRYMAPAAELDAESAEDRLRNALREHVRTVEFIDLLGIMHTLPGCAPLVAGALDGVRLEEIAGTIAGDDTVLVVTRSRPAAQRLNMRLRSMSGRDE
ncbi:MAG: arginine repressor [Chloroflexi bacterium]|nr:MAG: arginine repressor [Chloroflexota bacterium]TMF15571.1 MAG: arginine repressor [Chloroflexota bacterium]